MRRVVPPHQSPPRRLGSSGPRRAAHLPVPLTDILGRQRDLEASRRQLLDPHIRLLTFTGAPGTGKTRLALALADEIRGEFPDGVWFVSLAPLQQPELVLPTISSALGIRQVGGRSAVQTLAQALRERWLLLILDNFEHLLPAASAIAELLEAGRELTVLATSRAPLHIRGEHRFPVAPLEVPRLAPLPVLDDLARVSSVQLFVERTTAVRPDFELTTGNAQPVAELCVRLGGLPLAIELAAARSALLEPRDLLARLDQWMPMLTDAPRDMPARHRTLRTALAWSYDLLSPEQQRLFRRLGAFAGGASIEAIEIVGNGREELPVDVFDGVAHLLDHGLVRKDPVADDGLRVSLLEPIREFALERLEAAGELEAVQQGHAEYFVEVAETAAPPRTDGPDGPRLLRLLERDHDNFRTALRWLLDHGDGERSVRLAGALWSFWEVRGHWTEGLMWIERALAAGEQISPADRARALTGAAALHRTQGAPDAAAALARESVAIRRELGDWAGLAESLVMLADMLCFSDPTTAGQLGAEALAIRRARGDEIGAVWALAVLGNVAIAQSEFASARAYFEEGRALRGDRRDNVVDAHLLRGLGAVYGGAGEYAAARRLLDEALELHTTVWGSTEGMIWTLLNLGDLDMRLGDPVAGRARLEECRKRSADASETMAFSIASLLLKSSLPEGLPQNLRGELLGAAWRRALGREMPPVSEMLADPFERAARAPRDVSDALTPRELEVLGLLAQHHSNREIADQLVLSIRTVERHLANIYDKLGVSGRRTAVAYAREHGIGAN
ncbi:MAG: AAA family ATPase [Chloroflexi bacterium]|nr:AAA family ATPase [Chloroflexota bacterium]